MPIRALFFDLDGVLVDRTALHDAYQRHVGDVLSTALGGDPADWRRVNEDVYDRIVSAPFGWEAEPLARYRQEQIRTVRLLCEGVGIASPDDNACAVLGAGIDERVRRSPEILVAGAAGTVRALADRYALHAATGNASWLAVEVLRQLGVAERFGLPCGPDLLGVWKRSPAFYPALFSATNVSPAEAVVIDDSPAQIALAAAAGAFAVHVDHDDGDAPEAHAVIAHVDELTAVLRRLDARDR